jgi:hypothetical protein
MIATNTLKAGDGAYAGAFDPDTGERRYPTEVHQITLQAATSNIAKYRVGQHVVGLAGGAITGTIVEITANHKGATSGPGVLQIAEDSTVDDVDDDVKGRNFMPTVEIDITSFALPKNPGYQRTNLSHGMVSGLQVQSV